MNNICICCLVILYWMNSGKSIYWQPFVAPSPNLNLTTATASAMQRDATD